MNALTVNGKQLTLNNMNIHLNYAGEEATFDSSCTLYAGVYEFRVNVPDAVVVRCRNLPEISEDTVLPIVNGVAKLVLTSDVNIWNASIWPMWPQPEEYKDDPHYVMPVYLNSTNFELVRINFGEILGYNDQQYELWVDLGTTEYYLQGNQLRRLPVSLTDMPNASDLQYFTMIFDAKIWGSTGGQARIIIENNTAATPEDWGYQNRWGMRDHFVLRTPPQFFTTGNGKTWTTDASATSLVTDCSTPLWPENTYSRFKIVCDRTTSTCYLYIAGTYLGIAAGFSDDLLTWNQIYLYSDQGRSYEIAAVKNIKVAGFSTLDAARAWE